MYYFKGALPIESIRKNISLIGKEPLSNNAHEFQLLNALITTGINKFGKNYVISHRGFMNTQPTILDYAKSIGNQEIINYLENLGFMSLPTRNLDEEPIQPIGSRFIGYQYEGIDPYKYSHDKCSYDSDTE